MLRTPAEHIALQEFLREARVADLVKSVLRAFKDQPRAGRYHLTREVWGPLCDQTVPLPLSEDEDALREACVRISAGLEGAGWEYRAIGHGTKRWWRTGYVDVGVPGGK